MRVPTPTVANRGRNFEELILYSNAAYAAKRIAFIEKVPTPWQVRWEAGKVTGAWPTRKAFLDFVGVARGGVPVAFDVKETRQAAWPLARIEEHQYGHILRWHALGGLAFLLIWFIPAHRFFRVSASVLARAWDDWKAGGPASLTIRQLEERALEVRPARGTPLDYLPEIG